MRDKLLPAIGLFFVVILALVSLEVAKLSFIPYRWLFIDGVAPPEYLGMRALLAWANAITIGAILTLYGDYVTYNHHPDD